jgi:hypothetical protein
MKRVLLALIPVALLATASLAFTHVLDAPYFTTTITSSEDVTPPSSTAAAPQVLPGRLNPRPSRPRHRRQPAPSDQVTQPAVVAGRDRAGRALPEPWDKTPLTSALIYLDKAIQQAKLSVTVVDAASQTGIPEALNPIAGREEPNFRLTAQSDPTARPPRRSRCWSKR